ncbi:MAG: phosphoglycerate dehydrogenase [Anaerolineae bacterium]
MKGKIAVTPRSLSREGHPALGVLETAGYQVIFPTPGRQPTTDDLREFLPGCVGYLAGVEPVPSEVLSLCHDLKVISRNGVGVDNIDLDAARSLGIAIERAAGANARGVAELTIALMLAGLRSVPWSDRCLKGGGWARQEGIEVCGRTLGVIGCGQIGKLVAEMALGLGMRVRAYDLFLDLTFMPPGDFAYGTWHEVLSESDIISLHCPPREQALIDADAIVRMKRGAYLVNTARAALIDEIAVLSALEAGKLRGFATDVYDHEPPALTPLLCHDRVITTPHAGGLTHESIERATEAAVSNLLKVLEGEG